MGRGLRPTLRKGGGMNTYQLEVQETRTAFYEIEAESKEEALEIFSWSDEEPVSARDYHEDIINCRLIEDES